MTQNWILTLPAAAIWLYGLYLAFTRTRSRTATGVTLAALIGLFLATGGSEVSLVSQAPDYPYTLEKVRPLPALERITIAATNAEVIVHPGKGALTLTYRAKSPAALAQMHPVVEAVDGGLTLQDDRQPKGTAYRIELALPSPVDAKISLTNGILEGEDRLLGLRLSATNLSVVLQKFTPQKPSKISATNGRLVLKAFAPQADVEVHLTNGTVRVAPAGPLRVRANLTNGAVTYPGGTAKPPFVWGPEGAPTLRIQATNGSVTIE